MEFTHIGVRVEYRDSNSVYMRSVTEDVVSELGAVTIEVPPSSNANVFVAAVNSATSAVVKLGAIHNIAIVGNPVTTFGLGRLPDSNRRRRKDRGKSRRVAQNERVLLLFLPGSVLLVYSVHSIVKPVDRRCQGSGVIRDISIGSQPYPNWGLSRLIPASSLWDGTVGKAVSG